jgi:hypothetical protein
MVTPSHVPVGYPQGRDIRRNSPTQRGVLLLLLRPDLLYPLLPVCAFPGHPRISTAALADVVAAHIDGRVRAAVGGGAGTARRPLLVAGGVPADRTRAVKVGIAMSVNVNRHDRTRRATAPARQPRAGCSAQPPGHRAGRNTPPVAPRGCVGHVSRVLASVVWGAMAPVRPAGPIDGANPVVGHCITPEC